MAADLTAIVRETYPSAHEGGEYANLLADFLFWCRHNRVSCVRLMTEAFRKCGEWDADDDQFPIDWIITGYIEYEFLNTPKDEQAERFSESDPESIERLKIYESVVKRLHGEATEEASIELLANLYSIVGGMEPIQRLMVASGDRQSRILGKGRIGVIKSDEWYSVADLVEFLHNNKEYAEKIFRELGVDPTEPNATIAGTQINKWFHERIRSQTGDDDDLGDES